jgi:hypothetical protein
MLAQMFDGMRALLAHSHKHIAPNIKQTNDNGIMVSPRRIFFLRASTSLFFHARLRR